MNKALLILMSLGPEKITNGVFGSSTAGWTAGSLTGGVGTLSVVDGKLRITNNAAGGRATAYQQIATAVGKQYRLSLTGYEGDSGVNSLQVRVGTSAGGFSIAALTLVGGVTGQIKFRATSTATFITLDNIKDTSSAYIEFDDVSVR